MMMPWGWGMGGGWGFGIFGMVFMLVFWVLIIAGIVLVVRWLVDQWRPGSASGPGGLAWLSGAEGRLWSNAQWSMGPQGSSAPFMGPGMMDGGSVGRSGKQRFASNGERIYYTGVSAKTGPIPRSGGPMWVQMGGVGCVACHGVHGRGGVPVMMGTAVPPDIRYEALIKGEYVHGKKETPCLLKRDFRG